MGGGRSLCAGGLRSGAGDHPPDYLQPQQCIPDPPTPDTTTVFSLQYSASSSVPLCFMAGSALLETMSLLKIISMNSQ